MCGAMSYLHKATIKYNTTPETEIQLSITFTSLFYNFYISNMLPLINCIYILFLLNIL